MQLRAETEARAGRQVRPQGLQRLPARPGPAAAGPAGQGGARGVRAGAEEERRGQVTPLRRHAGESPARRHVKSPSRSHALSSAARFKMPANSRGLGCIRRCCCNWSSSSSSRAPVGLLLKYLGQPAVIGEMAAGIVLGPIVFGALAPDVACRRCSRRTRCPRCRRCRRWAWCSSCSSSAPSCAHPTACARRCKAAGLVGVLSVLLPMAAGLADRAVAASARARRRRLLAVRAVHGGGDVDHRVPGDGAHPQGPRDDAARRSAAWR